jgi:hypothetical protein
MSLGKGVFSQATRRGGEKGKMLLGLRGFVGAFAHLGSGWLFRARLLPALQAQGKYPFPTFGEASLLFQRFCGMSVKSALSVLGRRFSSS